MYNAADVDRLAEQNDLDAYELRETADLDFDGNLEAAKDHLLELRQSLHQDCTCHKQS